MRRNLPAPSWLGLCFAILCLLGAETARADRLIEPGSLFHEATSHERASQSKLSGSGVGPTRPNLKGALGVRIFTRDFSLPGLKSLGFRLIPTKRALAGDANIPFVLRFRLSSHRMGLDVGGHF